MTGEQTIFDYLEVLSSKAPVPGGGGASALGGALGVALGQMVCNLTVGKKRYVQVEEEIRQHLSALLEIQKALVILADRDAEVFAPLAAAYGMPGETESQREEKDRVMEVNLMAATLVPLEIMEQSVEVINILEELEKKGSRMAISDVGVAVQFARTALTGAVMNVYINTKSMKNREKAEELNARAQGVLDLGVPKADAIYEGVRQYLI